MNTPICAIKAFVVQVLTVKYVVALAAVVVNIALVEVSAEVNPNTVYLIKLFIRVYSSL